MCNFQILFLWTAIKIGQNQTDSVIVKWNTKPMFWIYYHKSSCLYVRLSNSPSFHLIMTNGDLNYLLHIQNSQFMYYTVVQFYLMTHTKFNKSKVNLGDTKTRKLRRIIRVLFDIIKTLQNPSFQFWVVKQYELGWKTFSEFGNKVMLITILLPRF